MTGTFGLFLVAVVPVIAIVSVVPVITIVGVSVISVVAIFAIVSVVGFFIGTWGGIGVSAFVVFRLSGEGEAKGQNCEGKKCCDFFHNVLVAGISGLSMVVVVFWKKTLSSFPDRVSFRYFAPDSTQNRPPYKLNEPILRQGLS